MAAISLVGIKEVGFTRKAANSASVNRKLFLARSRLTAVKPMIFGTFTVTCPPLAVRALAVISLFSRGRATKISLLILIFPPSELPASVVILLPRRNWMSRAWRLIFAPVPDTVVPSMLALLSRAIELATTLILPALPVPKASTLTVAPSRTINRFTLRVSEPAFPAAFVLTTVYPLPLEASILLLKPPLLAMPRTPMRSALIVISPASAALKEAAEILPPFRTASMGVERWISPPLEEVVV